MSITELLKLFHDFERYDRYTRDSGVNDTKTQRFYRYLSKMISVMEELQQILKYHSMGISDKHNTRISEHDRKALYKAATYYFKLEKRNAAAPAS